MPNWTQQSSLVFGNLTASLRYRGCYKIYNKSEWNKLAMEINWFGSANLDEPTPNKQIRIGQFLNWVKKGLIRNHFFLIGFSFHTWWSSGQLEISLFPNSWIMLISSLNYLVIFICSKFYFCNYDDNLQVEHGLFFFLVIFACCYM